MTVFLDRLKERKDSRDKLKETRHSISVLSTEIVMIDIEIKQFENENKYIDWLVGDR